MMKKLSILLLTTILFACGGEKEETFTYWINSYTSACADDPELRCILIQEGEEIDPKGWQNYDGVIENFVFEPEFMVKLEVTKGEDNSLKQVKVISKERDERFNLHEMWVAIAIDETDINIPEGAEAPSFEVNLSEQLIAGTDGCNRFRSSIVSLTANAIELGPIAQTEMACATLYYPEIFMKAFRESGNFKVENGLLIMLDGDKERLRFKKVN